MALPLRRQTWSFHTIEAKQEVVDSLRLHQSESSVRSTIEPLPSFTLTPAPPTVPSALRASSLGHADASPPASPAVDNPSSSCGLPYLFCGGKENAALLNLLPRPLAVQHTKSVDRANGPLPALSACPSSNKRRFGFAASPRPVDVELDEIEDESLPFTAQDESQEEIVEAFQEKEKETGQDDSLDKAKDDPLRKIEDSKEVQTDGGLGDTEETLPTGPILVDKKEEEKVIETENFKIFPSQEAFEKYARGRITAAHPKVTLELKRSPHTVTISCRNRRKEYTSCQFLLRGREDVGPDGFNGKYKLAKGGEDEVIGHNAACLARLNGGKASQTASKAASPAVSPPKDVQMTQPPFTMPLSSAKVVNQPKIAARPATETVPPIQIKSQPAKIPALPISVPPPTIIKAREVRNKRVIFIEPESDEELSDLEQDEPKVDLDKRGEQTGAIAPASIDQEDDSGESTEEEDFETPAQLRKRKAAHPGNVLPSRARRYRPAYYGL